MIKSELIKMIASRMMQVPEHKIAESINHILGSMSNALIAGNRVEVRGFGSFSVHLCNPRQAHNPKTGEKVMTKPKYSAHFKPGKELKERVNASRKQYAIVGS